MNAIEMLRRCGKGQEKCQPEYNAGQTLMPAADQGDYVPPSDTGREDAVRISCEDVWV